MIIKPQAGALISYSLPWPKTSLLTFLKQENNTPRLYWESGLEGLGFAGYGLAATLSAQGPERFQIIQEQANKLFKTGVIEGDNIPPEVGPRLFGGFSFRSAATAYGIWSAFPSAHFILPSYQLMRRKDQNWLTVNHYLGPGENPEQALQSLKANIQDLRLALDIVSEQALTPLAEIKRPEMQLEIDYPLDQPTWEEIIRKTTHRIRAGELDKVVLARVSRVRSSRVVEPVDVLDQLKDHYAACYRFLIEPIPGHAFYGATPELLAEVSGSTLQTVALAGSIGRGKTESEDEALGQELLNNPKERQEHAYVVEALRENLSPLVSKLDIPEQPNLYQLSNIQHLQTKIHGMLRDPQGVLPVVEALHPTPAMGGSPRETALQLITEEEAFSRGWYASPVGWLDAEGNGLFAVAIRSAVSVGHETCLFAGAGIVADSEPEREWQETGLKFRPILEALLKSAEEK